MMLRPAAGTGASLNDPTGTIPPAGRSVAACWPTTVLSWLAGTARSCGSGAMFTATRSFAVIV